MSNLVPLRDMESMAVAIAKSGLFGMKTPEQALALMVVAQSEGRHPGSIASEYHIIQGRPALKADAMLARFQQAGGLVEWNEYTDMKVSGAFSHPQSPKPILIEWTIEMAKRANLTGKDNWKNYPRQMLRARVISEGVRTCYPAVAVGVYTPEEVQDLASEKDITPRAGALASLTAARQEVVNETAAQIRGYLANDQAFDAYSLCETSEFDADEKTALWSLLDSKQRAALKRMGDAERAQKSGTISTAQHKRIEARIKELGADRDALKAWCKKQFGKDHFMGLSKAEYESFDEHIEALPQAGGAAPTDTDVLLMKAREFAESGIERYADWWNRISAAQRKAIGTLRHDEFKLIAAKVPA